MRRRLPRILLNAATAVSLVLCVASVALWLRSYSGEDRAERTSAAAAIGGGERWRCLTLRSAGGGWQLAWETVDVPVDEPRIPARGWTAERLPCGRADGKIDYPFAGNTWGAPNGFANWHGFQVFRFTEPRLLLIALSAPYWLLAAGFAVLPVTRAARSSARRVRRLSAGSGRCPECGYDLRATPARCPECGAVPPPPPPPT